MKVSDTVHYPRQGIIHEKEQKRRGTLRCDIGVVQELIKVMNDRTHISLCVFKTLS
jgi:hypothetical protein